LPRWPFLLLEEAHLMHVKPHVRFLLQFLDET